MRFGISLMLASYLWKLCFTLVLSPSLEDEQRLSVGVLMTVLKSKIKKKKVGHMKVHEKKGEIKKER